MVYDHQSKSSSWTPTPRKSSFFPPSHIQTKTEATKGSELVGTLPSKAQRDKIRRSLFGDIPQMTGAKAETASPEAKAVENPTQVSEEGASGEIQGKAETGLNQSQGYGVPSREVRNKIRRSLFGNLEQTPVQKQEEGTSPPAPLLQGEGSMDDAGGEEKGLAETEITLPIQAKLTIGEPNDKYEQEADRVARQVVDKIYSPTPETVQREEMGDEDEVRLKSDAGSGGKVEAGVGVTGVRMSPIAGVTVNRKVNSEGETQEASAQLEASIQGKRGSGQPLDESVKEPMEGAFGADFSGVRVHTDAKSDELNQAIQAKAFTTGEDIFFREGAYQPGNRGGQELLAHELTHVVQQKGEVVQRSPLNPQRSPQKSARETQTTSAVEKYEEAAFRNAPTINAIQINEEWFGAVPPVHTKDIAPQVQRKLYEYKGEKEGWAVVGKESEDDIYGTPQTNDATVVGDRYDGATGQYIAVGRSDEAKNQGTAVPVIKKDDFVVAFSQGLHNYGIVMAEGGEKCVIKAYQQISGEGKIVSNKIREIIVSKDKVKKLESETSIKNIQEIRKKEAEKERKEGLRYSSKNKDDWKSDHVNKAILKFESTLSPKLLAVVHHKVPRQLMIDFFSRLTDSQRFKLQVRLDVTGRKDFLSMGSNLQLGPSERSDETPDSEVATKSGNKYVAAFDPNKQKDGKEDDISKLYSEVYEIFLEIFKREPEQITDTEFNKVVDLMYKAEVLHYSSNKGELLESPQNRWEKTSGVWHKIGKDREYKDIKDIKESLRDLKNKSLRADFNRKQNIESGKDKYSISYYDANADVEERSYFGKLGHSELGFNYFDQEGDIINQNLGPLKKKKEKSDSTV